MTYRQFVLIVALLRFGLIAVALYFATNLGTAGILFASLIFLRSAQRRGSKSMTESWWTKPGALDNPEAEQRRMAYAGKRPSYLTKCAGTPPTTTAATADCGRRSGDARCRGGSRRGVMVKLTFTIGDDGKPTLEGPIDNKILALGLLEAAKDCLLEYHRNKSQQKPKIEIPRIVVPNGL
jgi:hypothetical protein